MKTILSKKISEEGHFDGDNFSEGHFDEDNFGEGHFNEARSTKVIVT
jgi:hypothetical protein